MLRKALSLLKDMDACLVRRHWNNFLLSLLKQLLVFSRGLMEQNCWMHRKISWGREWSVGAGTDILLIDQCNIDIEWRYHTIQDLHQLFTRVQIITVQSALGQTWRCASLWIVIHGMWYMGERDCDVEYRIRDLFSLRNPRTASPNGQRGRPWI